MDHEKAQIKEIEKWLHRWTLKKGHRKRQRIHDLSYPGELGLSQNASLIALLFF
jgi:hypothetical protein